MKRRASLLMLAILALVLAAGIFKLLDLGISSGRHYPPFSSLRHDPVGSSGLRMAFENVTSLTVETHLRPLRLLKGEPGVILIPGYTSIEESDRKALDRLTSEGWRVVVAFGRTSLLLEKLAVADKDTTEPDDSLEPLEDGPREHEEEEKTTELEHDFPPIIGGTLAIGEEESPLRHTKADADAKNLATLDSTTGGDRLPQSLPWPSRQVFEPHPDWETVYVLGDAPAVVQRHYGEGEVIALADGFHLLNEALKQEPKTQFLSWLIGPSRRIVFYEHHLGLSENPGMGSLVGQYGLWPFLGGVLGWFLLLFWKNANAFGPLPASTSSRGAVRGVAAGEGVAKLLERHLPKDELLETCLNEFEESIGARRDEPKMRERIASARTAIRSKGSIATLYNRAAEIINFRQL